MGFHQAADEVGGQSYCAVGVHCRQELMSFGRSCPLLPLHPFGAYVQLPGTAVGDMFVEPRQVTDLLSSTSWKNI